MHFTGTLVDMHNNTPPGLIYLSAVSISLKDILIEDAGRPVDSQSMALTAKRSHLTGAISFSSYNNIADIVSCFCKSKNLFLIEIVKHSECRTSSSPS